MTEPKNKKTVILALTNKPEAGFININLVSFGGILSKKTTYFMVISKTNPFLDNNEDYFRNLAEKVISSFMERLVVELEKKKTIALVTPEGKETLYSKVFREILEKFLLERNFSVVYDSSLSKT